MIDVLFRIPIPFTDWRIPIHSYGASIMVGFLLAAWISIRRLNRLPWKLDLESPGNRRLTADELVRAGKVRPDQVPEDDPVDLEALGASDVAKGEAAGVVIRRKNSDFVLDLAIISMLFGLAGGKILYLLQYPLHTSLAKSLELANVADGKLHPLGAIVGGVAPIIFFFWVTRSRRIAVKKVRRTFVGMTLTTFFCALAGARIVYIMKNYGEFEPAVDALGGWQSGFVLYGGLVPGFLAGMVYIWIRRRPMLLMVDLLAPQMLIGIAFGRIGCFLNGCCFGKADPSFPLCVSYPAGTEPAKDFPDPAGKGSLPVHPTQLYETVAMFAIFFALSKIAKKDPKPGVMTCLTALSYAAWRFAVEFIRGDERPSALGGLSFSQLMSVGVAALFGLMLAIFLRREPAEQQPKELVA